MARRFKRRRGAIRHAAPARVLAGWAVPESAYPAPPAARILALDAPEQSSGPMTVRVAVSMDAAGEAVLSINGGERARAPLEGNEAGPGTVTFDDVRLPPGRHRVVVALWDPEADTLLDEQGRDVQVVPPPRIVGFADPDAVLRRALEAQQVRATFHTTAPDFDAHMQAGPPQAEGASRVDVVVADAKLLGQLSPASQQHLVTAVRHGMGLVVGVGNDKGAWHHLAETPLAAVLPLVPLPEPKPPPPEPDPAPDPNAEPDPPVDPPQPDDGPGLKTERRPDEARPITLLLVIDKSKSMAPHPGRGGADKFAMALQAARLAADALGTSDQLGVMVFAEAPSLVVSPRPKHEAMGRLRMTLQGSVPDGNATNIYLALKEASAVMQRQRTPIRHIVLLTDGEQYPPGPIFSPVVIPMARRGISLTTVGIGRGARMDQLRDIVRYAAGGLAIYAPSPEDVPVVVTKDTDKVVRHRNATVEAEGLLRDREKKPEPDPDPPTREEPPPAPKKAPPAPPAPPAPTREPLRRQRGHVAVAQFQEQDAPRVGRPRMSRRRGSGQILLVRREDEPVLAAGRAGLGRVLTWTLPDDDPGMAGWDGAAGLLTQVVRAARTPTDRDTHRPRTRILQHEDGAVLTLDWPRGAPDRGFEILWTPDGAEETEARSLGHVAPGLTSDRIRLPAAPPGTAVRVSFLREGREVLAARTYRARALEPRAVPAGNQAALDAAFGSRPKDLTQFVDTLPWGERTEKLPIDTWLLWFALALLPADVWLHRHRSTR